MKQITHSHIRRMVENNFRCPILVQFRNIPGMFMFYLYRNRHNLSMTNVAEAKKRFDPLMSQFADMRQIIRLGTLEYKKPSQIKPI